MTAAAPTSALDAVQAPVAGAVLSAPTRNWWIAFAGAGGLTLVFFAGIAITFSQGIGAWGNNTSVVWGFGIANYVWWIGIGNAGTLISSMLLLTRQTWRASINRFAEAMTLFAAMIAGIFPVIHMGRPMYWYWLSPYPNTMTLWPQWRSPLVWDFWAILAYLSFSIIFWYVGLIPDLATLRERARRPTTKRLFGAFALGWTGSSRQWRLQGKLHKTLAILAVPLVCSVHSIVGLDFAASMAPGWTETIFPPYFVVGAMFSGFCMVIVLAAIIRKALKVEALITPRHFEAMAKIVLAASIIMGLSYATEWFSAWYGGDAAEGRYLRFVFTGPYAGLYAAMIGFNVLAPQVFWFPAMRRRMDVLLVVAVLVNIGMWLERILIIFQTMSHERMPSMWRLFRPTITDAMLLIGSLGAFALAFLLLSRIVPLISMHEAARPEALNVEAIA